MVNLINAAKDSQQFMPPQASENKSADKNICNEQLDELAMDYDIEIIPDLEQWSASRFVTHIVRVSCVRGLRIIRASCVVSGITNLH